MVYLLRHYEDEAVDVCRDNQDSTDTFADPTLLENLHVNHVSFFAAEICLKCLILMLVQS